MSFVSSQEFRVYPKQRQADGLDALLADFCGLYNAALQQREEAWKRRRVSLSYEDQANELPALRAAMPDLARWSYTAQQQLLRRVNKAYQAFFRRVRRGEKPGFPRYKARSWFSSAEFRFGDGLTLRTDKKTGRTRLRIAGIDGGMRLFVHRPLRGKPVTAVLTRRVDGWFLIVQCRHDGDVGPQPLLPDLGVDLGFIDLVTTSDGLTVPRERCWAEEQPAVAAHQRAMARRRRPGKKHSQRYRKAARLAAKAQRRVARRRKDRLHKTSRLVVNLAGRLGHEALTVTGLCRGMLARSAHDVALGTLIAMVTDKAAWAGKVTIPVDPSGTSQTCPVCDGRVEKALSEREHRCLQCGYTAHRDVAAAQVVEYRAFGTRPGQGLQHAA
ncbi:transposase [Azospirillum sp. A1-3]|uniref:RNA-guided endonuclease InsQ/TnpB family protein n=1 Tax=Azospirillum sp. A1-3 TaxID=185874 RepID=UPI00207722C7|nr:transposase [Azospirillum sp. A1-3]MCM8738713.1 transposase [Azospirillum sp. A1-3]